ncbi:MAG: hypothetical protein LBR65_04555 [Culturomica sp.]|jgi:hypothetical protein|nr:hypothetical protein [Culturomica sp.]
MMKLTTVSNVIWHFTELRYRISGLILFLILSCPLCGQDKIFIANPVEFLNEIEPYRDKEEYDIIIANLQQRLQHDTSKHWCYYQLACIYSLKQDTIQAFAYLYKALDYGVLAEDVLSDTDFQNLYYTKQWETLTNEFVRQYLEKNKGITLTELSVKLWFLKIADQKFRTLRGNYKMNLPAPYTLETALLMKKEVKNDKQRAKYITNLIRTRKKWFYYSEVGKIGADAALYIIQHAKGSKRQKQALPYLKQAVEANEADPRMYAVMLDRYLIDKGKKQIYGTSWYRDKNGTFFYEIEDFKNINVRRAQVGMSSIEDLAKRYNIELPK